MRWRSGRCQATLAALAVGLAGCGGGGGKQLASTATTVTSSPGTGDNGGTAAPAKRARLPGPPGPTGPDEIVKAIGVWHPLVESGVPDGRCQPLLDSVKGKVGSAARQAGGGLYVSLYQGIAEGCLGQVQAARTHLGQARQVGLADDITGDPSCNAQRLLVFGFDTYLNEQISPNCQTTKTTTAEPTTKAPTTTAPKTTTTSRSTSTTR